MCIIAWICANIPQNRAGPAISVFQSSQVNDAAILRKKELFCSDIIDGNNSIFEILDLDLIGYFFLVFLNSFGTFVTVCAAPQCALV